MWCDVFNVGRATLWAFADCLGVNPKADPETIGFAILILMQVVRPQRYKIVMKILLNAENIKLNQG